MDARRNDGPYIVQYRDGERWWRCPGEWVSLADAKQAATVMRHPGIEGPSDLRVISIMDVYRQEKLDSLPGRMTDYELRQRGLVRSGLDLRSGDDDELDEMWAPRGRHARRLANARTRDLPPRVPAPSRGQLRSFRLEFIGHDIWSILRVRGMRPWVAMVSFGEDGEVVDRNFIDGLTDYEEADKLGCRGVMLEYLLKQGVVYEVFDRARERGPRRVFQIHDGQCWHDISREAAIDAAG